MITSQLINPQSIVVIGASNDVTKTGGKALKNLLDHHYPGKLYAVNPKETNIQGLTCYKDAADIPQADLAILAIAARFCPDTVETLAREKNTRAFVIFSAGFSEESAEGAKLEKKIVETCNRYGAALIGPNCIGMMNSNHTSVFSLPIPKFNPKGIDFISGSGATAVFIMETAMQKGLSFASVYSVGNSAQMGVEDVLMHLDETFDPEKSSRVKLLYIESVNRPAMLLKHASSLIRKGCRIAAIKAGSSAAGSRAASSHTGAMASPDVAVDALFRKAGIVRCYGREELTTVAGIFMHKELKGKNIAIITHAGGPAVMLTDALSEGGLEIPHLESPELLSKLFAGSSVANPIDFLATGTAEQLGEIIEHVDKKFDNIDGMAVIFGSPGLFDVSDVYKVLDEKMHTCNKPIFPILPSIVNVKQQIDYFISLGRINFPEEVIFGKALCKVYHTPKPQPEKIELPAVDIKTVREVIDNAANGYLSPGEIQQLLDSAGIRRAGEAVVTSKDEAVKAATVLGFPVVMKVVGPIHKSDVGGVVLNVNNCDQVAAEFDRMIRIKDTTAILLQSMHSGIELFAGAKYEPGFGHMVLCGLGGIFIEVLKDVSAGLSPLSHDEAESMIRRLRGIKILEGVRGQQGVDIPRFADVVVRLSALLQAAPEIMELDLNPLLGKEDIIVAVDARIRIEKNA
ncbi:MAG TPA: acetate--CoA ligase family protein [Bacteroidales bacterium]|nr:acetate--CoA ligase family protein [Bacteroidales bacterium]HPT01077.1 acetate--CoA ligase family protein [Bacteroidales bacterium]